MSTEYFFFCLRCENHTEIVDSVVIGCGVQIRMKYWISVDKIDKNIRICTTGLRAALSLCVVTVKVRNRKYDTRNQKIGQYKK